MIKVYNIYTEDHSSEQNNFYVGRGSPLGNPYTHDGKRSSLAKLSFPNREDAIDAYREYFKQMYKLDDNFKKAFDEIYDKYKNGEDIYLQCFCKPLPCHADIIAEELQKKLILENIPNKKSN